MKKKPVSDMVNKIITYCYDSKYFKQSSVLTLD